MASPSPSSSQSGHAPRIPNNESELLAKEYKDLPAHKPLQQRPKEKLPEATSANPAGGVMRHDQESLSPKYLYKRFWNEFYAREEGQDLIDYSMQQPYDIQDRMPRWVLDKNVAIDGTPLTTEEKGEQWWEHRYRKELLIGERQRQLKKLHFEEEQVSAIPGEIRRLKRFLGFGGALPKPEDVKATLEAQLEREAADRARRKEELEAKGGQFPSQSGLVDLGMTWDEILAELEHQKPLAVVAKKARPRADFYSIDQFLDSAPSIVWSSCKLGLLMGCFHGGFRALQAAQVDAQFMRASGIGIFSVINVAMFASMAKWGGNCALFALCFIFGDRLATAGKTLLLPPHEAVQRSPFNYSAGLACAFAAVGIVPYWMLRDVQLGVKLAANGLVLGGALGWVVGLSMNHLVSAAVARVDVKPRELRRYEALMRRNSTFKDQLMQRRFEIQQLMV